MIPALFFVSKFFALMSAKSIRFCASLICLAKIFGAAGFPNGKGERLFFLFFCFFFYFFHFFLLVE
jgi:hypothetical protein